MGKRCRTPNILMLSQPWLSRLRYGLLSQLVGTLGCGGPGADPGRWWSVT
jgi:hypothetical protein